MIDDDEVAVALELVGKRDRSLVDAPDRLAFGDPDFHAVSDDGGAEAAARLAAEGAKHGPARRPGQVALERSQGQRRRCSPAAAVNLRIDACSFPWASWSSPVSWALRSRRASIESTSAVRAATARSAAERARAASPLSASSSVARACSVLRSRARASNVA